jgi:threonine aldolase
MARRLRKVLGGGMRQAGYLAAACIYALDHHRDRLKEDHKHAKQIAEVLRIKPYVKYIKPVDTNVIIFGLQDDIRDQHFISTLKDNGILAIPFGGNTIRFVTHLDVSSDMISQVCDTLNRLTP